MKTLLSFVLLGSVAWGQYTAMPATLYPALDGILNGKLAFQTGASAPVGACVAGKDIYTDTTAGKLYFCTTGGWQQVSLVLTGTTLPGTCRNGEMFVKTDATPGTNVYVCIANAWVQQGGAGGTSDHALLSNLPYAQSGHSGFEAAIAAGTMSQYYRGDKSWQALNTAGVPEVTNLYFTNARVLSAMASLYEAPLTFTAPLSRATNTISCVTATGSVAGCLSATDWTTFNAKQPALGFTPENNANKGAVSGYAGLDVDQKVLLANLPTGQNAANLANGAVSDAEFESLHGVTSAIQGQIDGKEATANKGAANGYASLNSSTQVPDAQLGSGVADATKVLFGNRTWGVPPGGLSGSGTTGNLPRLTASTVIGDSNLAQHADGSLNATKAVTTPTGSTPTFNAGGTTTCDWSASNVCYVVFGAGNTTLAFTGPHGSGPYVLRSKQDATGGRSYTFAGTMIGFAQPDTAANAETIQPLIYDGSTNYYALPASVPNSAWHGISASSGTTGPCPTGGGSLYLNSSDNSWYRCANGGLPAQLSTGAGDVVGPASSSNENLVGFDGTTGKLVKDLGITKAAVRERSLGIVLDGGGSAITTGAKGWLRAPYACTIVDATLTADQTGSIVIDVWKDTYANYPPTVADTITASAKPTLASATKTQDTTLTGWTTTVAAGDFLKFNVDSATTVTQVTLSLTCRI